MRRKLSDMNIEELDELLDNLNTEHYAVIDEMGALDTGNPDEYVEYMKLKLKLDILKTNIHNVIDQMNLQDLIDDSERFGL